jgi:nucleotide-binding universal stress UspA family protein
MTEIRNILCPVDRSDVSLRALLVATGIAKWYGARLRVIEVVGIAAPSLGPAPLAVYGLTQEVRRGLADELDRFSAPAREAGVDVRISVEEGDVVGGILHEAEAVDADLIVIGTHGRSGFQRLTLGSIAEKVLRRAISPVLTVPPGPQALPAGDGLFKRILCAVDFSMASLKGVEFALSLAKEADARVTLVHVLDWPRDGLLPRELEEAVAGTREQWEATTRERLHALVPAGAREWCTPDDLVIAGRPAEEILRLARERAEDVIVLGVHGRGALDLALFGSTTHRVVREAPCPVFTIRSRS